MEEIKVGEYCRTKNGIIFQIDKDKNNLAINDFLSVRGDRDILKHSPNIIDLIEVGDYVNGEYTIGVCTYKNGNIKFIEVGELQRELKNKDIKSIVTKEQFNSIKYVIGE